VVDDRQCGDQFAQRHDQARDVVGQDFAGDDVGHQRRGFLVKAHHHRVFLRHVTHRQARAVAVIPGRAVHWPQDGVGLHLGDVLEVIFQHALLHRDLRARLQVLHRAAAAVTEVDALGLDPHRRRALQRDHAACFPVLLFLERLVADALARQRAFDEDHFTGRAVGVLEVANAAPVHVEGFDVDENVVHGRSERSERRGEDALAARPHRRAHDSKETDEALS
jgi:hypothetical protein